MKKTNIKTNKRKLVARVMLLVLLVASALNLGACGKGIDKYVLMRCYDTRFYSPIELQVSSNSKMFSKDDITFNLSYSMNTVETTGEFIDPNCYYYQCIDDYDILYGMYVLDEHDYKWASQYEQWYVDDIKNLENHYFVRQITEQDALTEKYISISPRFAYGYGFYRFNHSESITIPKQFASAKQGTFVITIIMFGILEDGSYIALDSARIECFYNEIDENTIEIDMKRLMYFRIM